MSLDIHMNVWINYLQDYRYSPRCNVSLKLCVHFASPVSNIKHKHHSFVRICRILEEWECMPLPINPRQANVTKSTLFSTTLESIWYLHSHPNSTRQCLELRRINPLSHEKDNIHSIKCVYSYWKSKDKCNEPPIGYAWWWNVEAKCYGKWVEEIM